MKIYKFNNTFKNVYVIGDIHGNFNLLKDLIMTRLSVRFIIFVVVKIFTLWKIYLIVYKIILMCYNSFMRTKEFKRCPRCNNKSPINVAKCGNCGLNYDKFEAELELLEEPVYEGCGNDEWSVKFLTYNSTYGEDEEFYATLIDENTLLLQHLYPFDGTQGVSYQTYTRK